MINRLIALIAGALFGMGMMISQMVDPAKVLGFLNISGNWDPSLAFVMGGALMVFAPAYHFLIKPRNKAVSGEALKVPTNKQIDTPLLTGAALFGLGWGIAGICPGPALTAMVSGQKEILFFIAAMALGQVAVLVWQKTRLARLQEA